MHVERVSLRNFRNHTDTSVDCSASVNILYGPNGTGKTTVLEALSVCAFSKTFLPSSDEELCQRGRDAYGVHCNFRSDHDLQGTISVAWSRQDAKQISLNTQKLSGPKELIGTMPMVLLSPDFKSITFGGPQDRRSFIDRVLSQCYPRYFEALNQLRRVLKQRNLLLSAKGGFLDRAQVEAWSAKLIDLSTVLCTYRRNFVRDIEANLIGSYQSLTRTDELLAVEYRSDCSLDAQTLRTASESDIKHAFTLRARELADEEFRRGLSLWGPQKDDLAIILNGGRARESASQGQHKSILVCLKKAEFEYLKEQREETPIMVLDDIFSELDEHRSARIFDTLLSAQTQIFISTTEADRIAALAAPHASGHRIGIDHGAIVECRSL